MSRIIRTQAFKPSIFPRRLNFKDPLSSPHRWKSSGRKTGHRCSTRGSPFERIKQTLNARQLRGRAVALSF